MLRLPYSLLVVSILTSMANVLSAQAPGTIRGRVFDTRGEPLAGASVSALGTHCVAVTRRDGSYQMTLPAGRYELHARHVGYVEMANTVTLEEGQVELAEFRAERSTTRNRSASGRRQLPDLEYAAGRVGGTRGKVKSQTAWDGSAGLVPPVADNR
jgi:Carboxypeptidase regulatory-like domain